RLAGVFRKTAGVILGAFNNCREENSEKHTLTLGEVIQDYLGNSKKPVIYNLSHGHIKEILTLPIGLKVKINSDKNYIEFTESVVV
ncbi:MAG: LD-carboxypeptidase, partial [Bacteroidetes bacterium]|nr:LD-carboxypeptidase [Bacteroidota bacterium]